MSDEKPTCAHETDLTEILVAFTANQYQRGHERPYEVCLCRECYRLINLEKSDDVAMTPDEVIQLFVDLRRMIVEKLDDIQSPLKYLAWLADNMITKVPKPVAADKDYRELPF